MEAGLTKRDIRALSRAMGLSTTEKPASACLASRIPYHAPITAQRLARVERAENALKALLPPLPSPGTHPRKAGEFDLHQGKPRGGAP